jgi:hypothetical protein
MRATGPQELQLLLECAEVYQAPTHMPSPAYHWTHLTFALQACPYPALVEFTTHHGRTLLTLAERSLEAALAAAAAGPGGGGGSSSARGTQAAAGDPMDLMETASQIFSCLCGCVSGRVRGGACAGSDCSFEAKGEALLYVAAAYCEHSHASKPPKE